MHDEDNDGGFAGESPSRFRCPRSKQEERGDRSKWPWQCPEGASWANQRPGVRAKQAGGDSRIDERDLRCPADPGTDVPGPGRNALDQEHFLKKADGPRCRRLRYPGLIAHAAGDEKLPLRAASNRMSALICTVRSIPESCMTSRRPCRRGKSRRTAPGGAGWTAAHHRGLARPDAGVIGRAEVRRRLFRRAAGGLVAVEQWQHAQVLRAARRFL
jgi:hypothetical protein